MMTKTPGRKWIVLFAVFWSSITGVFLAVCVYGCVNQLRTLGFAEVPGTIDTCEVTSHDDSDGTTYGVDISYHYDVGGKTYTSKRLRFVAGSASDSWAKRFVAGHPAKSRVLVYYNRKSPEEAVLIRGIAGSDLFLLMFLTPFTVVMVGLWVAVYITFRPERGFLGMTIVEEGMVTRVTPSRSMVVAAGAGGIGGSAFLAIFVVGFLLGGFHPELIVMGCTWAVVLAAGIVSMVYAKRVICGGSKDIVLDDEGKFLRVGKNEAIAYGAIGRVSLVEYPPRGEDSQGRCEVWVEHAKEGQTQREKVMNWGTKLSDAPRFAAWLGARLGVPVE